MKYKIPVGTECWRRQPSPPRHRADPPKSEYFISTKEVVYEKSELLLEDVGVGFSVYFVFRLPKDAAPWDELSVYARNVITFEE